MAATKLSKRFGVKRVFDRVDLDLDRGEFLLVTGPNGAGKSTLLRVLAGLGAPTGGELELPGRGEVGYLGHEPLVYRELTPLENLHLFGRLYRVPDRAERIGMLLERFGLWEVRDQRVSTFSRGMQQRLSLCRVLLHDPALLIMPTSRSTPSTPTAPICSTARSRSRAGARGHRRHPRPRPRRTLATARLAFG